MKRCNKDMKIYCDEIYYTGSNVFDTNQPYFAYGCYIVEDQKKESIANSLGIGNKEKKKSLEPSTLHNIIKANNIRYQIYFADKIYSLACNIVHWIIDEVLYHCNINTESFYKDDIHSFFANIIYLHYKLNRQEDLEIIKGLYDFLMRHNYNILNYQIKNSEGGFLQIFIRLVQKYNSLLNWKEDVYFLDLSVSSLVSNISLLSQRHNFAECEILYDESKPITLKKGNFEVNLQDIVNKYNLFPNIKFSFPKITTIQALDSKKEIGIQIADIMNRCIIRDGFLKDRRSSYEYFGDNINAMLPIITEQDIIQKKPQVDKWLNCIISLL